MHTAVTTHPVGEKEVRNVLRDIPVRRKKVTKTGIWERNTIISEHSHTPYEKVWKDSDRNYCMTAEEAKEYGMISKRERISNLREPKDLKRPISFFRSNTLT